MASNYQIPWRQRVYSVKPGMKNLKTKLLLKLSDRRILSAMVLGLLLALKTGLDIQPFGDDVSDKDINVV